MWVVDVVMDMGTTPVETDIMHFSLLIYCLVTNDSPPLGKRSNSFIALLYLTNASPPLVLEGRLSIHDYLSLTFATTMNNTCVPLYVQW
jgi:hypothetical protein